MSGICVNSNLLRDPNKTIFFKDVAGQNRGSFLRTMHFSSIWGGRGPLFNFDRFLSVVAEKSGSPVHAGFFVEQAFYKQQRGVEFFTADGKHIHEYFFNKNYPLADDFYPDIRDVQEVNTDRFYSKSDPISLLIEPGYMRSFLKRKDAKAIQKLRGGYLMGDVIQDTLISGKFEKNYSDLTIHMYGNSEPSYDFDVHNRRGNTRITVHNFEETIEKLFL